MIQCSKCEFNYSILLSRNLFVFPFIWVTFILSTCIFFPTPATSMEPALCGNLILMLSLVKGYLGRPLLTPQVKDSFSPDRFRRQPQMGIPGLPQSAWLTTNSGVPINTYQTTQRTHESILLALTV